MYIIMSLYLPKSEILLVYNAVLRSRADSFRFMFFSACWVIYRAQELCESRGGRHGLPSLIYLRFLWT